MKKALLIGLVLLVGIVMIPGLVGAVLTDHFDYKTTVQDTFWENWVEWNTGIIASGTWGTSNTALHWVITDNDDGWYTYQYSWYSLGKDLSHIIIELTPITWVLGDNIVLSEFNYEIGDDGIGQFSPGPGNPEMPALGIYGIKADLLEDTWNFVFSFNTQQAPVWGNFYAKSGDGTYAYNTGFADLEDGVFIPRPDGMSVPEPSTMLLLGVGLIGLAGIGRKKFVKKQ
jgi:hypothetical protein